MMVFGMSAEARAMKMAVGIVSVLKAIVPASVTVAPNSPTALAQQRITALTNPRKARGKVMRQKACQALEPRERATAS